MKFMHYLFSNKIQQIFYIRRIMQSDQKDKTERKISKIIAIIAV